ncbi:MAG: hypothetical protein V3U24_09715 [Candidatus Neomarinimicrobiota bacterium]
MYHLGNTDLLDDNPIAIYGSRDIPISVHNSVLSLVNPLMESPVTLAGGWQSKLEKALLKARRPGSPSNIIYVLAKGIHSFRVSKSLRGDLDRGKVLIISPWMSDNRIDEKKVTKRDDFILNQMGRFLFLHIREGGNLEELFFRCLELGKEVFLLDDLTNETWANPEVVSISGKDLTPLIS